MNNNITFKYLVSRVPELGELEKEILNLPYNNKNFCAVLAWHNKHMGYKHRIGALVGFYVDDPDLRKTEYFDVATRHLYHLLPNCTLGTNCSETHF